MTEEQILKAFNGRWRIKGFGDLEVRQLSGKDAAKFCLDFFRTGIILGCEDKVKEIKVFDVEKMHSPTQQLNEQLISPFEYWWDLYDKKRGKEKCMKKWNKMSNDECVACIKATPAYVESTPDKVYRKDPLTYLNGKCWNDEIIIKDGTNNKEQQRQQRLRDSAELVAKYTRVKK